MVDLGMYQRFQVAVESLGGEGDVRARLLSAYLSIDVFNPEELPEDIRDDFKQLQEAFTWLPAEHPMEGKLHPTLREMSEEEAVRLAGTIRLMADRVAEEWMSS